MKNRKRYLSLAILAVLAIALAAWCAAPDTPVIRVAVGETKVVRFPGGITRISLGSTGFATLTVTTRDEMMINGTAPGVTTLHIWDDNHEVRLYSLQVLSRFDMFVSDAEKIPGAYSISLKPLPHTFSEAERSAMTAMGMPTTVQDIGANFGGGIMIQGFVRDNQTRAKVLNLARVYFTDITDGLLLPGEDPPLTEDQTTGTLTQSENTVITKLFAPRSRSAAELNTVLTNMLSENGRIIVDASTNSLIVIDTPQNVETISRFIKRLDEQTTAQVMIEAKFVELSEAATRELGVDWTLNTRSFRNSTVNTTTNMDPSTSHTNGGVAVVLDAATGNLKDLALVGLTAQLAAMEKDGKLNLLSAPSVTTINGQAASVDITSERAYVSGYTFIYDTNGNIIGGTPTISTAETGIKLNVTPTIGKDDIITMAVTPEVSILSDMAQGGAAPYVIDLPLISRRTTTVTVQLQDGGTLIIAGLMQDQSTQGQDRVPLLGRIPLIGYLFRSERNWTDKSNITVFITAHIIKYGQTGSADATVATGAGAN